MFWDIVGLSPTSTVNKLFQNFPHVELEKYSPRYTQEMNRLGYSARVSGPPAIPPFQGGESVIRLSLGKLLVNLLQVVKRTNTPLIPQQMASSTYTMGFWGRGFKSHIHLLLTNKLTLNF